MGPLFDGIIEAIYLAVAWPLGLLAEGNSWLWSIVWQTMTLTVKLVGSWGFMHLPEGLQQFFQSSPWEAFVEYWNLIAWFFPIYPTLGLFALMMSVIAGIRLIRWILGIIPTIEG